MKILLMGEYSNVHHTLASALKRLGHEVLLVSDGDGWKNYPRDVDLRRRCKGHIGSLLYLLQLLWLLPRLRGFDVVQCINPIFLDLKPQWNRRVFSFLKRHNGKMALGLFGDDYYVVSKMRDNAVFPYTDFYDGLATIDASLNHDRIREWTASPKKDLTCYIAQQADVLIACLYEYYKCYEAVGSFAHKLHYIGLPIDCKDCPQQPEARDGDARTRILLGIQKKRGVAKGTDRIELWMDQLVQRIPNSIALTKVYSLPFAEYCQRLNETDVLVDQLYSYTPAMNALEAMSRGIVVISGGEEVYYKFIGEEKLRPIINLHPYDETANLTYLVSLFTNPAKIAQLKKESIAFVKKHHDSTQIARQYLKVWEAPAIK